MIRYKPFYKVLALVNMVQFYDNMIGTFFDS